VRSASEVLLWLVLGHGDEPHLPEPARTGGWHPVVLGLLLLSAVAYALGSRTLSRRLRPGQALRGWERACFWAGWAVLGGALLGPLDALSERLFAAHMTQHELLMLVAAPLMVLGRPLVPFLWALPDPARRRVAAWAQRRAVRETWRAVTHPFWVLVLHGLAIWIWHLPFLFEAALAHPAIHGVQHALFFLTAALFFHALVHGRYGRVGYGVAVLYVFATATHAAVLGALLTFARHVWYAGQTAEGAPWGLEPLEDQQLAGLIMWVPAGALFLVAALALFAAWLGEAERRASRRLAP
jgi:cytochrome c oxidase assembly factor CtaG